MAVKRLLFVACFYAEAVVGESVVVIKKLLQMQVGMPFHLLALWRN